MSKTEVVVITGGSAGVGRATAREFAKRGASIALLARDEQRLKECAQEVEAAGGRALPIVIDISMPDAMERAAATVEEKLGPIDIWINNAMTTVFGRVSDISAEELRRVTDVTYHGAVFGTMAALKRMKLRNRGTIVQVGSSLAYRGIPLQAAYCAAKHALRAFTDSLRSELIHDGIDIHLTMVQLAATNTPQFRWCRSYMPKKAQPVPPIYQPEVAARAIYFAAHHRRREIWVGGSTIKTIIGSKLLPGYLDHYLADKGFSGQQLDVPEDPDRPSNLFEPVPGSFEAHGDFDARASERDWVSWLSMRTGGAGGRAVKVAGIVGGVAILGALLRRTR